MASVSFSIESDLRRKVAELQVRVESEARAAASRALNRSITAARTEAIKVLRKDYPGLKVKMLRSRIRLQRATRKDLSATLTFSGKRFSWWGNFPVRTVQTPYGTGIRVPGKLPYGLQTVSGDAVTPAMLARAFVQRTRSGTRPSVWVRVGRKSMPIEALVALGLSRAFVERRIGAALIRVVRQRFADRFAKEIAAGRRGYVTERRR